MRQHIGSPAIFTNPANHVAAILEYLPERFLGGKVTREAERHAYDGDFCIFFRQTTSL